MFYTNNEFRPQLIYVIMRAYIYIYMYMLLTEFSLDFGVISDAEPDFSGR